MMAFIDRLVAISSDYVIAGLMLIGFVLVVTLVFGTVGRLVFFERDDDDIRRPDGLRAHAAAGESETRGPGAPTPA